MNKKAKRRLMVVGGVIVVALLVIVAVAGSGSAASSLTIGDVLSGGYEGKKVQVSGSVVADSLQSEGSAAVFSIEPEDGSDESQRLRVRYDGALPSTFGAGVVAICTGTVEGDSLLASEMVTKCPSKYESAEGSLTVKGLLDQGDGMVGKETKVCGYIQGAVNPVDADHRFVIESQGATIRVIYDGGLDDAMVEGTAVVVSGSLDANGDFVATDQPSIDSAIGA
ncbi:MAG: cytochrome c maturation protein CcmE [Collinsella sp.]|nr:cytochrome c maturation protein CcmE [Collinsella sp.]